MDIVHLEPANSGHPEQVLRLAVAAYLARYKGESRTHTESDLRSYLDWCRDRGLPPLTARRPHVELYVRWMQEVRRYALSTISRRVSVVAGFYRTCVIDGVLEHSPADYIRVRTFPRNRRRWGSATSSSRPS
jgi:site-specific recombinase XerD